MFFGVEEIMTILGIKRSKAYDVIKGLREDLSKEGYLMPPAGRIQKTYFCERYKLNLRDCERFLKGAA